MNIIALASGLSSTRGGIEKSLLDICRGLHQRGHKIFLIYENSGDQLAEYETFCEFLYHINSYRISRKNPLLLLSDLNQLRKILPGKNCIVYSSQYYNFFFASLLAFARNAPLIGHIHLPPPTHLKLRWNNAPTIIKERLVLNRITRFIAVSKFTGDAWARELNLPREEFDIVYNGIDFDFFRAAGDYNAAKAAWGVSNDRKVISYIGRLDRHKGIETAIKAFALLHQKRKDIIFLIAGKAVLEDDCYVASLAELANTLGVGTETQFVGHLSDPRLLYQASDITVVPSVWAEPFGRVVIESMACETPVVASRIGGIPEAITDEFSHHLFEPEDENELATIIGQIVDWRTTLPELGRQCRMRAEETFPLESIIAEVEASLRKACSRFDFDSRVSVGS